MARLVFVLSFGEPEEAFFADTFLALLCADARRAGHQAEVVRVHYHGREARADQEIRERLSAELTSLRPDLVVVERLFDPVPLAGWNVLQVTRGDSVEPAPGVRHVLGAVTELMRGRGARSTPSMASLRRAFEAVLGALERGDDLGAVAGVATAVAGELGVGSPLPRAEGEGPFDPVIDARVIAPGAAPPITHKTLLGNVGCPFAADPLASEHYRGIELPEALPIARLGCAFCHMGGDYEKRPEQVVVERLVEQAKYFSERLPEVQSFALDDQHALGYLGLLLTTASARGVPPRRWLFPARPDSFVRERPKVQAAAREAARLGHRIEVHLSGFEAFSDRELERYAKGCSKADLLAAVGAMRELQRELPESFDYRRARAHSLILWNPWTSPADVRESVTAIRDHELDELFHDIGRNRLRLYRELPIYWAALRDGALLEGWKDDDEGSARRKGYSSELPWRFLDERTRVAHEVAARLRDRLGRETELDQLDAALDFAEAGGASFEECKAGLAELESTLDTFLVPDRGDDLPARGFQTRAVACRLRPASLPSDFDAAFADGRPLFTIGKGPGLADLRARATREARPYGLLVDAGCPPEHLEGASHLSVRVRSTSDSVPHGDFALEARVSPRSGQLAALPAFAAWAREHGVPQLRVEIALHELGLGELGEAAARLRELGAACRREGVALEVAPLASGLGDFRFLPSLKSRSATPRS